MLNISQKIMRLLAIFIGTTLASIYSFPLNAQTNTVADSSSILEGIEAEENLNWGFTSENESISVKDDIKELENYSISESSSEEDVKLIEDTPKWGNRGDIEDYSFEVEVYDY